MKRSFAFTLIFIIVFSVLGVAFSAQFIPGADPEVMTGAGNVSLSIIIKNDSEVDITNIAINYYGQRFFNTDGLVISPGEYATVSTTVYVSAAVLGVGVPFTVQWNEGAEVKTQEVLVPIRNGNDMTDPYNQAYYVSATRTVSTAQAAPGEVVTITYTVTNTGAQPISGVSIVDKDIGGRRPMVENIVVEPNIPYIYTREYTMGSTTVTSSPKITYTFSNGSSGVTTVAEKIIGMVNSRVQISVEAGVPKESGQDFKLVFVNSGNQRMENITVKDEQGKTVKAPFALSIGEQRVIHYSASTQEGRNLYFTIDATDGAGNAYSDKTDVFVVRKYIDPALVDIEFTAAVTEQLNAAGSISLAFSINNTSAFELANVLLTEEAYGEVFVSKTLVQGLQSFSAKLHTGEPRDLEFTLKAEDPAGNEYFYTAYISADHLGEVESITAAPTPPPITEDRLANVGSTISGGLKTAIIMLGVLTLIALFALVFLGVLANKERERIKRRKAMQRRKQNQLAAARMQREQENE